MVDDMGLDLGLESFHNLCFDTERKNLLTESDKFDLFMGLLVMRILHLIHGILLDVLDNKCCFKHLV